LLSRIHYYKFKRKEKEKKNNIQNKKEKKRKEILNNDLAVLPSHDKHPLRIPDSPWCHDLAKRLSQYLYFFSFLLDYY